MLPAARLGRFEVLAKLAAGGMGEIFLARLEGVEGFEKLCVIKRILPHLADDTRFRQMMIAEAQIASKMSHANVSQIYELDEIDGQLYIVMEYLEGVTLLQLLRRFARRKQPLDLGLIAGVIGQIADGLHYAHELRDRAGKPLGIVHRDVTPSNVFITDGGVAKVLDFGIAKVENVANTQSGAIKGKYAYMAPEQLRGQDVDRRADVFALGIVLFEMLALRRLFQRKTDYLTFNAVIEEPILDVTHYRPDTPKALIDVMNRALASKPEERFETVRKMRAAVLAATPVQPWGTHEIAEFITAHFADDIAKRHASVANATHRDRAATMPVIVPEGSADPDSEGGYFEDDLDDPHLGVGSSVISAPVRDTRAGPTRMDRPPRRPDAPSRRRWWLIAPAPLLVCVAITIWLAQRSSSTPSAPVPPSDPYAAALFVHKQMLDGCVHQHGKQLPPHARANVFVEPDGHVYQLAFDPAAASDTSLGGCIRDQLRTIQFPAATERKQIVLEFTCP